MEVDADAVYATVGGGNPYMGKGVAFGVSTEDKGAVAVAEDTDGALTISKR